MNNGTSGNAVQPTASLQPGIVSVGALVTLAAPYQSVPALQMSLCQLLVSDTALYQNKTYNGLYMVHEVVPAGAETRNKYTFLAHTNSTGNRNSLSTGDTLGSQGTQISGAYAPDSTLRHGYPSFAVSGNIWSGALRLMSLRSNWNAGWAKLRYHYGVGGSNAYPVVSATFASCVTSNTPSSAIRINGSAAGKYQNMKLHTVIFYTDNSQDSNDQAIIDDIFSNLLQGA